MYILEFSARQRRAQYYFKKPTGESTNVRKTNKTYKETKTATTHRDRIHPNVLTNNKLNTHK